LRTISIWFFLIGLPAFAQTTLSGRIGGMTLDSTGNPYLIMSEIIVDKGQTLALKPGCILLFRQFTGLRVNGSLIVEGSQVNPVIFTTVNDNQYNPASKQTANPFDWNGLLVETGAGRVIMSFFTLAYSGYGLRSKFQNINISNGVFRRNGQAHFLLNDKLMPVADDIPYSYSIALQAASTPFSMTVRKVAFPVVLGISGVLFGGSAYYFYHRKNALHREYSVGTNQTDLERKTDAESKAFVWMEAFSGASAICVSSAAVLFIVGARSEKHKDTGKVKMAAGITPMGTSLVLEWLW
jgi:hypothetical protein